MKRIGIVYFVLLTSIICRPSHGEEPDGTDLEKNMYVGGYFSLGMAAMIGDGYEEWMPLDLRRDRRTLAFAHGSTGYFIYYFTEMMGIQAGLGFLTKGIRYHWEVGNDDFIAKERFVYMELPVAFKLNVQGFQAAVGLALFVALGGKRTLADEITTAEIKWTHDGDPSWAMYHRANVGPWINLGYAIEVGPLEIVPSVTWMVHLINDLNNDGIPPYPPDETDYKLRAMNFMINAGFQWGF